MGDRVSQVQEMVAALASQLCDAVGVVHQKCTQPPPIANGKLPAAIAATTPSAPLGSGPGDNGGAAGRNGLGMHTEHESDGLSLAAASALEMRTHFAGLVSGTVLDIDAFVQQLPDLRRAKAVEAADLSDLGSHNTRAAHRLTRHVAEAERQLALVRATMAELADTFFLGKEPQDRPAPSSLPPVDEEAEARAFAQAEAGTGTEVEPTVEAAVEATVEAEAGRDSAQADGQKTQQTAAVAVPRGRGSATKVVPPTATEASGEAESETPTRRPSRATRGSARRNSSEGGYVNCVRGGGRGASDE